MMNSRRSSGNPWSGFFLKRDESAMKGEILGSTMESSLIYSGMVMAAGWLGA